jgi:hypothetical protein
MYVTGPFIVTHVHSSLTCLLRHGEQCSDVSLALVIVFCSSCVRVVCIGLHILLKYIATKKEREEDKSGDRDGHKFFKIMRSLKERGSSTLWRETPRRPSVEARDHKSASNGSFASRLSRLVDPEYQLVPFSFKMAFFAFAAVTTFPLKQPMVFVLLSIVVLSVHSLPLVYIDTGYCRCACSLFLFRLSEWDSSRN